jgi:hypothetical protein
MWLFRMINWNGRIGGTIGNWIVGAIIAGVLFYIGTHSGNSGMG